jgi:DNA-binding transcriptional MocR family regulator
VTSEAHPEDELAADDYFALIPESVLYDLSLSEGARILFAVLQRHADARGASFPSRARLAELLGVSLDTIDRRLRELEGVGRVTKRKRHDASGRQTSSLYTVRVTRPLSTGAATVRREGRTDAAPRGRTDAALEGRTDAARNQSHRNQSQLTTGAYAGERLKERYAALGDSLAELN